MSKQAKKNRRSARKSNPWKYARLHRYLHRYFAVRGAPDFRKLFDILRELGTATTFCSPSELGFSHGNVEPLTSELKQRTRGALPTNNLETLQVWDIWSMATNDLSDTYRALDIGEEHQRQSEKSLSSSHFRLARLIAWIGSVKAGQRYIKSVEQLNESLRIRLQPVEKFITRLEYCQSRWTNIVQKAQRDHWATISQLEGVWQQLEDARDADPEKLWGDHEPGHWQRSLLNKCLERYSERANSLKSLYSEDIPNALAALYAVDRGTEIVQSSAILRATENPNDDLKTYIFTLQNASKYRAYDQLLKFLNNSRTPILNYDVNQVHHRLAHGNSGEIVTWYVAEDLLHERDSCESRCGSSIYRLSESLKRHGLKIPSWHDWVGDGENKHEFYALNCITHWLDQLPAPSVDENASRRLRSVINTFRKLPSITGTTRGQLGQWSRLAKSVNIHGLDTELPIDIRFWIGNIQRYQRMSNQKVTIPKSIRKHQDFFSKCQIEFEHLEEQASRGLETESQTQRRTHLSEILATRQQNTNKIKRVAIHSCVIQSLDAITEIAKQHCEAVWREHMGDIKIPSKHQVDFAQWVTALTARQKRTLAKLIATYDTHKESWKLHFGFNKNWLSAIEKRNIDVDRWITPPTEAFQIDDKTYEIYPANNPVEILLMGSRFKTCLSLAGGYYSKSVLNNALDGNKHVLYIRDSNGDVVGRKLVSVGKKFEMLGFYNYQNQRGIELGPIFNKYCARWAHSCRLELNDDGTTRNLSSQFCYDDDPIEWSDEARATWQDCRQQQLETKEQPKLAANDPPTQEVSMLAT
jgi:hypothetical protein